VIREASELTYSNGYALTRVILRSCACTSRRRGSRTARRGLLRVLLSLWWKTLIEPSLGGHFTRVTVTVNLETFPVRCRWSSRIEVVVVPEIPSFPAACLIRRHLYTTTSQVAPNFELTDVPFVHRFWKFRTNNSAITEVDK
jgi:hypothetical protein